MGGAHPSDGLIWGVPDPRQSQPPAHFIDLASISSSAQGCPRHPPGLPGSLYPQSPGAPGYCGLQRGACSSEGACVHRRTRPPGAACAGGLCRGPAWACWAPVAVGPAGGLAPRAQARALGCPVLGEGHAGRNLGGEGGSSWVCQVGVGHSASGKEAWEQIASSGTGWQAGWPGCVWGAGGGVVAVGRERQSGEGWRSGGGHITCVP